MMMIIIIIIVIIILCEMTVELFFSQSQNLEVFRKSTSYSCWKYYYIMAGIVADQKWVNALHSYFIFS